MEVGPNVGFLNFIITDIVRYPEELVTMDPYSIRLELISQVLDSFSNLSINFLKIRPLLDYCVILLVIRIREIVHNRSNQTLIIS